MNPRNFLLVDDDLDDKELFVEAAGSVDADVACVNAVHGRQALEILRSPAIQPPDLIFLDINMPIMNGWQFLAEIKENDHLKNIPVIMYSTSSKRSDLKTALSNGALCFFTKPDSFQRLKKILALVLQYLKNDNLDQLCEAIQLA